jgi:hypothetical protein
MPRKQKKLPVETMLMELDGLFIMDAVAEVIADRVDADLENVKQEMHARGTQELYEGFIARGIDDLASELGYS